MNRLVELKVVISVNYSKYGLADKTSLYLCNVWL